MENQMENQNNLETLQKHEGKFGNKKNPFFEHITEVIKTSDISTLEKLHKSLLADSKYELNKVEFELLGAVIFMIGIETFNQPNLNKILIDSIIERKDVLGIDIEYFQLVTKISPLLGVTNVDKVKEAMKKSTGDKISISNPADVLLFEKLIIAIKSLIKNSLMSVNLTVNINEIIKAKKSMTLNQILQLNGFMNSECSYIGYRAKNALVEINSNKVWQNLIDTAVKAYDDQKYAYIYFDHIITMCEYGMKNSLSILLDGISGKLTEADYVIKPIEEETTNETTPVEKEIDKTVNDLDDAESQRIISENPVEALFVAMDELLKRKVTTTTDVLEAAKLIIEDPENDYVKQLYGYMNASIGKINNELLLPVRNDINILEVAAVLNDERKVLSEKYKVDVENVCKPIDENIKNRLKLYVVECIKCLILETEDQKNYLISQMIEPQIDTYNQLQQIMGLIETCKIDGAQMLTYVTLYEYINYNDEITELFGIGSTIADSEIKNSMYTAFISWFTALTNKKAEEIEKE